jgi:hypothetical protein
VILFQIILLKDPMKMGTGTTSNLSKEISNIGNRYLLNFMASARRRVFSSIYTKIIFIGDRED